MQDLVTPPPTRLVPHPVSQHTGKDSKNERRREAKLPVPASAPAASRNRGPGIGKPIWCANNAANRTE